MLAGSLYTASNVVFVTNQFHPCHQAKLNVGPHPCFSSMWEQFLFVLHPECAPGHPEKCSST